MAAAWQANRTESVLFALSRSGRRRLSDPVAGTSPSAAISTPPVACADH
ncbi:hypothetical protein C5F59_030560 [Streptomyces sp. QL37]|nr:hypothetical protein [Streptomyces sp. QL37]